MFLFRWCDKLNYLYLGKFNKKNVYLINFEDYEQAKQCSRGVSLFIFLIVVLVSDEGGGVVLLSFVLFCLFGWLGGCM